jgi:hypothetical protein
MKTDIVFQWSRRVMFFTALSACKTRKRNRRKNHPRKKSEHPEELLNHAGSG